MKAAAEASHLEHAAFLYSGLEGFLDVMVPFVADGVDNDEIVFIAARGDYLPALREELGDREKRATWADAQRWCPHPATRLRAFHELVTDGLRSGAARLRLAGEPVWPEGPPGLIYEWQRYDSALNEVLGPYPATVMCLYDATHLDPSLIATARRTHPEVCHRGERVPSPEFEEPQRFLHRWNLELSAPPPDAARIDLQNVAVARRFLQDCARAAGLGPPRVRDLLIAANEVITNALVHACEASLAAWSGDGYFICQIDDRGGGIADSLTGYRPPAEGRESGRGLWMARQLVDLLQVASNNPGTSVRMHIDQPAAVPSG